MNHKEKLIEIYSLSSSISDIKDIPEKQKEYISNIANKVYQQKGVFTVLITLSVHKILHPAQDIRYHQSNLKNGFSGRSVDTQYITPTLKGIGLPSMAESGWLTRSLEQPYPYILKYNGRISDKEVKKSFLNIIDFVQRNPSRAKNILRLLLHRAIEMQNKNKVKIVPLKRPDRLTIDKVIGCLTEHFAFNYRTHGGSKLPVLAFYGIYSILINEIKRYDGCRLAPLGSHTACDRTSKTSGDIQIFKDKDLLEAIEIKLNRPIDKTVVRNAIGKIIKYNPKRYYILSSRDIVVAEKKEIQKIILIIKEKHGCQIILNGLIPTLKYYLRLISSLDEFVKKYSKLVGSDSELKKIHKEKWNELLKNNF